MAVGGAAGSVLRAMQGDVSGALWGTLTVNAAGAFALGALLPWVHARSGRRWRELLAVGLVGGYTTFSTFIGLVDRDVMRGEATFGLTYLALSVCLGLLLVSLGAWIAQRCRRRRYIVGVVAVGGLAVLAVVPRAGTMSPADVLTVALGGAIGAAGRYALATRPRRHSAVLANALGTLVLGLTVGSANPSYHLLFATGLAGGLTTFSAFAADLHALVLSERWREAARYGFANVLGAWIALHVGLWCAALFL